MKDDTIKFLCCVAVLAIAIVMVGIIEMWAISHGIDGIMFGGAMGVIGSCATAPFVHYYHVKKRGHNHVKKED